MVKILFEHKICSEWWLERKRIFSFSLLELVVLCSELQIKGVEDNSITVFFYFITKLYVVTPH